MQRLEDSMGHGTVDKIQPILRLARSTMATGPCRLLVPFAISLIEGGAGRETEMKSPGILDVAHLILQESYLSALECYLGRRRLFGVPIS